MLAIMNMGRSNNIGATLFCILEAAVNRIDESRGLCAFLIRALQPDTVADPLEALLTASRPEFPMGILRRWGGPIWPNTKRRNTRRCAVAGWRIFMAS